MNFLFRLCFGGVLLVTGVVTIAADILAPARPDDWLRGPELLSPAPGDALLAARGDALISRTIFPIDPNRKYRLTGLFQTPAGKPETKIFFGIVCMDRYRRIIQPEYVQALPETRTELAEPVAACQEEIRVRDASHWTVSPVACVAFDVPADGKLTDLPNRKVSSIGIREIIREESGWLVKLNGPAHFDSPAGTPVRIHLSGPTYHYPGGSGVMVGATPRTLEGVIGGVGKLQYDANRFYPGTANCRIVILPNYDMPAECAVQFSGIKLQPEGRMNPQPHIR